MRSAHAGYVARPFDPLPGVAMVEPQVAARQTGETQMSRWMVVGAVLATTAPFLLYPVEGRAQDTAYVLCGFESDLSWARIINTNAAKPRSMCRWKCVYATKSGGTHINSGAFRISYLGSKTTNKGVKDIVATVGMAGACP
jgi:hypothetical protein